MTTTRFRKLAPGALVLAWILSPIHAHAATGCASTAASLTGSYAMLISGAAINATLGTSTPKYQAGAVTFDGVNRITGSHIYTGAAAPSAVTGTYSLNTDCTLTLTLAVGATATQTFTVALNGVGEALGIEVDNIGVATIDFQPQLATTFSAASLNGTFAGSCVSLYTNSSDVNLVTFSNGQITSGTDPYNNGGGAFVVADVPYNGSYAVNSDGTFAGTAGVSGNNFAFYGVVSNAGTELEYIYSDGTAAAPTSAAFESCKLVTTAATTVAAVAAVSN